MTTIPIIFSINDYYVPYFAVCLLSLQNVANNDDVYELHVLSKDISDANKEILTSCLTKKNMSLFFTDMSKVIERNSFKINYCVSWSIEVYFRFYIPLIFKGRYPKVLNCDSDIIFRADPADLFNSVSFGNNKLAAAHDIFLNARMDYLEDDGNRFMFEYMVNDLAINEPRDYFNAGILLFNIDAITAEDVAAWKRMATGEKKYIFNEQDILNYRLQGEVSFFDNAWNYMIPHRSSSIRDFIPSSEFWEEYAKKSENCKIIHYIAEKPWFYPVGALAAEWWTYARKTVFYEEILRRMMDFQVVQIMQKVKAMNAERKNSLKYSLKYFYYSIVSRLLFFSERQKKRREYYKEKIKKVKTIVKMSESDILFDAMDLIK